MTCQSELVKIGLKSQLNIQIVFCSLPYCLAVLYESMRHSGIVPAAPPRSVVKDVNYKGYLIPKVPYENSHNERTLIN